MEKFNYPIETQVNGFRDSQRNNKRTPHSKPCILKLFHTYTIEVAKGG